MFSSHGLQAAQGEAGEEGLEDRGLGLDAKPVLAYIVERPTRDCIRRIRCRD